VVVTSSEVLVVLAASSGAGVVNFAMSRPPAMPRKRVKKRKAFLFMGGRLPE
jgi:hypothetical protein